MADFLRTALSGLRASQHGLATAGHNIANVNNRNYSRQYVELVARRPELQSGRGYVGTGVELAGIGRAYDAFLSAQVREHSSGQQQLSTLDGLLKQLNSLVAAPETSLAPALQDFFNAMRDVAEAPHSTPARQVALSQAESMVSRFRDMDAQLQALRDNASQGSRDTVTEINTLAEALAKVNSDIQLAGGSGAPGDLLDQRDGLLGELARRVNLQTVFNADGTANVFIGKGQSLVLGNERRRLEAVSSIFDPSEVEIRYAGQKNGSDISEFLSGGKIGGYLGFRNEVLAPMQRDFGMVARGIAEAVNAQHRAGVDLGGRFGRDFFSVGAPRALSSDLNAGSGALGVTVADVTQLQRSDYELSFDGASYRLTRLSDKQSVWSGAALPPASPVDGLDIRFASGAVAAGDRFLIQPTHMAGMRFDVALTNPGEIAAAAPILATAGTVNKGTGRVSAGDVVDAANAALQASVEIVFTSDTQFSVIDKASGTPVSDPATGLPMAGLSFTPGQEIRANGWSVELDGVPKRGDTFVVEANASNASGDNRNAQKLADLESKAVLLQGPEVDSGTGKPRPTADFKGFYAIMVADSATRGNRTSNGLKAQEALLDKAVKTRDSLSGVNVDEEAGDILKFQQSYQASAQLIQLADELFKTLLGAVAR